MRRSKLYLTATWLLILPMLTGCNSGDQRSSEGLAEDPGDLEVVGRSSPAAEEDLSLSMNPPILLADALDAFSSYRLDVNVDWTRDVPITYEGSSQGYILRQQKTRQPDARQVYQFIIPGIEEWWVEANGSVWDCFDPESVDCTKYDQAFYPLNHPLLAGIESILLDAPQDAYGYIGEEDIAGLITQHFTIEYPPLAEVVHWDEENVHTIQNVHGDIWIVHQAGMPFFVVKAVIHWEGFMDGADGQGVYEYIVRDINADLTIPLPQE